MPLRHWSLHRQTPGAAGCQLLRAAPLLLLPLRMWLVGARGRVSAGGTTAAASIHVLTADNSHVNHIMCQYT
jgi:hypothetical protein